MSKEKKEPNPEIPFRRGKLSWGMYNKLIKENGFSNPDIIGEAFHELTTYNPDRYPAEQVIKTVSGALAAVFKDTEEE